MSLENPIVGKRLLDQVTLVPIFIAYLKLQLQKDLEKARKDPQYIPQYQPNEIKEIIEQIEGGICSGFSAFLGHKLLRGKFQEAIAEVETLNTLKRIGFDEDRTFKDNGKYLISQKKYDTPEGEELNRKYNPMVALLEDILTNMRWLQAQHEIPFRDSWDEYEFEPLVHKEFISILSENPIKAKNLFAFCQKYFQVEASLSSEILNKETMAKLKTVFQKSGEKAALRYLDELLNGALEKSLDKSMNFRATAIQTEWDKLINFVVGEETPKLQHNFSLHFILKEEEVKNIIRQVFSSLESSKIFRLKIPQHALLVYKEGENYYFSDPNNGILFGPYTNESVDELTSLVLDLFPYHTTNFEFGIDAFEDPIKSKLDKPLDASQMISELLEKRAKSDEGNLVDLSSKNGWTSLHLAARHGHLSIVQELLKRKADISATNSDGETALHLAALYGHFNVVQELLEKGATIEARTKRGYTALHAAAQHGHLNVVKALLEKGERIEDSTYEDYTALHIAVMTGQLNMVQLLLDKGAMNEATDWLKQTALHIAVKEGHLHIVQMLLDKGAKIEAINSDGETALHLAAKKGYDHVVQLLIERRADIAATNPDRNNALHIAARYGHHHVVQMLIKNGTNIEEVNVVRETALHLAAKNGHHHVVQVLLESNANIEASNRQHETALLIAASNGHLKVVQRLLAKKPNLAAANSAGDTPLHLAARHGHLKIVQALLAANANIHLTNNAGKTALQLAKDGKHDNIVKILGSQDPQSMHFENPPAAINVMLNQSTLVPIFIAYLKLQLQKDLERASRDPQYMPQYHQKDIEAAIAQIEGGICSGFCAFIGHKLLRGKFKEARTEVQTLSILKWNGFNADGSFQDNGEFLINQKKFGTPDGEELNRKYNPMVELLEDILSNMRWLQSGHETLFRDIWDEYEFMPQVNKEFIAILSEEPIDLKNLIAFCQKNFEVEESLLVFESFNKETMTKLKAVYQRSGENEKAALRYLDQLLKGRLEKSVAKEKDITTTVMQAEWDKLINFVVGDETPKLQNNLSIHLILKKEEVEEIIQQVFSSLKSTKMLRLRIPKHTLLVYKEGEDYYFSDPNDGRLFNFPYKESMHELTSLVFELFPYNTTNFEFGIDVFGDPVKSKLDNPIDPTNMISELLQKRLKIYGENLVDLSSEQGWTSLHLAATNGYLTAVEELLKNKADIGATNPNGWTALHLAADRGHLNVIQKLLEKGANINAVISSGETALHVAAMNGHFKVVQALLDNNANIDAITPNKFTALHLAAKNGHLKVVEVLLNKKADLAAAIDLDQETALHLAATHGYLNIVNKLLEKGAAIDAPNWQKNTVLHLAAKNGNLSVVQKLLEGGAKIEAVNSDGETALHLAAKSGHLNVVQMLLDKGGMIEAANSTGKTPLYLAVEEGHLHVVQELLKKKPNIAVTNKSGYTILHLAAQRGDLKLVRELLDKAANIKALNSNRETALHLAARNGHLQIMLELLKKGAKLETTNLKGETALALADRNGHTEVIKFFKIRQNIHLAAEAGDFEGVQELIEKGADINATNSEGYTALHLAAKQGHHSVVRELLVASQRGYFNTIRDFFKKEARIETPTSDSEKYTPLHLAAKHGQLKVVLELLEKGAKIEAIDSSKKTALHLAASKGHLHVVKALIKKGAKVDALDSGGYTPLHSATLGGHVNVVHELLKNKANIAATTSYGYTALHVAAITPYDLNLVVRELLKNGANIEALDRTGDSVLHLAAQNGQFKIMQELLAANVNIHLKNKAGKTPLQVAKDCKQSEIVKLLEAFLQSQPEMLPQRKLPEKSISEKSASEVEPDGSKNHSLKK